MKGTLQRFGKYAYLRSRRELYERIDTTLISDLVGNLKLDPEAGCLSLAWSLKPANWLIDEALYLPSGYDSGIDLLISLQEKQIILPKMSKNSLNVLMIVIVICFLNQLNPPFN